MARRLALLALVVLVGACSEPGGDPIAAHQHALEERLLAPCCWRQTLADHDSPLARSLRAEIGARLEAGEPAAAIERDLVARHGEAIRALPAGGDPRWIIGVVVATAALASLLAIALAMRRRRRRTPPRPAARPASAADERYADRLDDELLATD